MRDISIDSLKGISIVAVIVVHIPVGHRVDSGVADLVYFLQIVVGWCVLSFFFASGFLRKGKLHKGTLVNFYKKKFDRLIFPAILFGFTYKVMLLAISHTGKVNWSYDFPSDLAGLAHFLFWPVGPQFYFLYYLFFVSVLDESLARCLGGVFRAFAAVLISVCLFELTDKPLHGFGPDLNLLPLYYASYVAGRESGNGISRKNWPWIAFFAFVTILSFTISDLYAYVLIPFLLRRLIKGCRVFMLLEEKLKLGKYSSGIYVWHAPILISFASIVCVYFFGGGVYSIVPTIGLTLVLSILVTIIVSKFSIFRIWRF